jgi:hypothetical protein
MSFAPLLHPQNIFRAAEVVPVGGTGQPASLAGGLAGAAAIPFGAKNLMVSVARIGCEQLVAAEALAMARLAVHEGRVHASRQKDEEGKPKPASAGRRPKKGRRKKGFKRNPGRKPEGKNTQFQSAINTPLSFCR